MVYICMFDGFVVLLVELLFVDPEMHLGGGGFYGTVGDYLCFMRMFLEWG